MKELRLILEACESAPSGCQVAALATVVSVAGSAYRRPGARMLVFANGERVGAISGGCLEADVAQRALRVIESRQPEYVFYSANISNGDVIVELGCKGSVGVLIEPLPMAPLALSVNEDTDPETSPARECLRFLAGFRNRRGRGAIATVYATEGNSVLHIGDRFVQRRDEDIRPLLHPHYAPYCADCLQSLLPLIQADLQACMYEAYPRNRTYELAGGVINVLIEPVTPPISLVICGAGHDARPLAAVADLLGWDVTVIDHRDSMLAPGRFPGARTMHVTHPEAALERLALDDRTAAVIMSHSYERDREWLKLFSSAEIGYLGLLGPRHRAEEMLAERDLLSGGISRPIFSPIGLDIGAETAEEIALAIVAEIQSVLSRSPAGFLRDRGGPIHRAVSVSSPERELQPSRG